MLLLQLLTVAFESQTEIAAAVCSACANVYLKQNPTARESYDGTTPPYDCFKAADTACIDCKTANYGCTYEVEQMAVNEPTSLVSSQFSSCRGHSADSAEKMSLAAWARLIGWRRANCPDVALLVEEPSRIYDDSHRSAFWWEHTRQAQWERQTGQRLPIQNVITPRQTDQY